MGAADERAVFYVGGDPRRARWIATVWVDGDPAGVPRPLLAARTAEQFRRRAVALARDRNAAGHAPARDRVPWWTVAAARRGRVYFFDRGRVRLYEAATGRVRDPLTEHDAAVAAGALAADDPGLAAVTPAAPDSFPSGRAYVGPAYRPALAPPQPVAAAVLGPAAAPPPAWFARVFPGGVTTPQALALTGGVLVASYLAGRWLAAARGRAGAGAPGAAP